MTGRKPTRARALGVSDDDYAARLDAQHGHCALCPNRPKSRRLHADHDHLDPAHPVRGLLCMRCNRNLPTWVTPDWLLRAALYLDPDGDDVMARGRAVAYAMTSGHCPVCGCAYADDNDTAHICPPGFSEAP